MNAFLFFFFSFNIFSLISFLLMFFFSNKLSNPLTARQEISEQKKVSTFCMNLLPSKITCFATNNRKSAPFPIHQSSPKDSFGAQVRRWTRFWLSQNIDPCSSTSTAGSDLEQDCSGGRNRVLPVEFARQNSSKIRRTNLDLSSQTLTSALSKVVLMVITAI